MRRSRKLVALLVLGAVAAAGGSGTFAAFTATTATNGQRIASGTVDLDENPGTARVVQLSGAEPGETDSGCLKVTYTGTLPSTVRVYGTTGGTGLDQYMELTVTRGAYSPSEPAFGSCTNFQPDATNYVGQGPGVVYTGTVRAFPDAYAGGLVDPPSGGTESWTNGESHVYRFEVALVHNLAAQGLNATQDFTWEARSQ